LSFCFPVLLLLFNNISPCVQLVGMDAFEA
jgi:hypothetical protein